MFQRTRLLVTLTTSISFCLFSFFMVNTALASQPNINNKQQTSPGTIHGKVSDIINSAGYTYAEVDSGKEKVWAAATTTPLNIGDTISFSAAMPMKNFHSKSMKRDFSVIYFVPSFITHNKNMSGAGKSTTSSQGKIKQATQKPVKDFIKLETGNNISEIYKNKTNLDGKIIRIRGQVTKFTSNVLGKNWLHIKDNSTTEDMTITTNGVAAINDIIIIEGKLALDRDFGYGYVYPLIVEEASVSVE